MLQKLEARSEIGWRGKFLGKMAAVHRAEDVLRGRKKMLERAAGDLAPGQAERVRELLQRYDDDSRKELERMLGEGRARRLLRDLGIQ